MTTLGHQSREFKRSPVNLWEAEQKAEWSKSRMGPRAEKQKNIDLYWFIRAN